MSYDKEFKTSQNGVNVTIRGEAPSRVDINVYHQTGNAGDLREVASFLLSVARELEEVREKPILEEGTKVVITGPATLDTEMPVGTVGFVEEYDYIDEDYKIGDDNGHFLGWYSAENLKPLSTLKTMLSDTPPVVEGDIVVISQKTGNSDYDNYFHVGDVCRVVGGIDVDGDVCLSTSDVSEVYYPMDCVTKITDQVKDAA